MEEDQHRGAQEAPSARRSTAFVGSIALHFAFGKKVGFPAIAWSEPIYGGWLGDVLRAFNAYTPVMGMSLVAFNAAIIIQEFVLLFRARAKSGANKTVPPILWYLGFFPRLLYTLVSLPPTRRRRYGGYIVHLGIALMFLGFTGKSWTVDKETTSPRARRYQIERFTLEYIGPRMEVDTTKRMVFADIRVKDGDKVMGQLAPAKFIYKKMPDSPTTEVAMLHSIRDDLYLVVGSINPQTKVASLQIHLNPLVGWIWFGAIILLFGSFVCRWPELQPEESSAWQFARGSAAIATSVIIGILIALMPVPAFAQGMEHTGTVKIENERERGVFSQLRCMCGSCARDILSTCSCSTAEDARVRIREKLAKGEAEEKIIEEYTHQLDSSGKEYGLGSLAIPPNAGAMRAIYAVPLVAIVGGGIGLAVRAQAPLAQSHAEEVPPAAPTAEDDKLRSSPRSGARRISMTESRAGRARCPEPQTLDPEEIAEAEDAARGARSPWGCPLVTVAWPPSCVGRHRERRRRASSSSPPAACSA